MALPADLRRAWIEGGLKTILTRSLKRIVRPAIKVGTLVFKECDLQSVVTELSPVAGIVLREALIDDASLFEDRRVFLARFNEGHRCFMGIVAATGKLASYRWINTSAAYIPELKRFLILKPGHTYEYDVNTLPEFRRRGIDAYMRQYTYQLLRDAGYTKLYEYIHGDNHPSLRASRHLLRVVGRVWYIKPRAFEPIMIGSLKGDLPELSSLTSEPALAQAAPSGSAPRALARAAVKKN